MGEARLRFEEFGFQRLPNGRCRAKVVLAWADGRRFEGSSDGVTSQKVRAFDATVVIVSLSARAPEEATRLVGSCLTEKDPPRGAALAVLNATNRLLGNYLATR